MRFTVTMKTPDRVESAIDDATGNGMSSECKKKDAIRLCEKWFRHGEYGNIEIDTELKTAKVLEA